MCISLSNQKSITYFRDKDKRVQSYRKCTVKHEVNTAGYLYTHIVHYCDVWCEKVAQDVINVPPWGNSLIKLLTEQYKLPC